MPLSLAQKSSIRRHLGYPVAGLAKTGGAGMTLAGGSVGYRWLQAYGFLEYKMNNLGPDEECRVTGYAYAALAFVGPQPNPGDTVAVTLSGGAIATPQVLTVSAPNPAVAGDNRINLVNALANAGAANAVLQAANVQSISPFGTGAYSANSVPFPEVAFTSPVAFAMTVAGSGVTYPQITADGALLPPVTQLDGVTTVYGYLPILDGLEGAFLSSSQNLDTGQASVWKGRSNEIGQRMSLYAMWKAQFSDFIGIPLNPDKFNNQSRNGAMQYM